jgi:hypothetical protein
MKPDLGQGSENRVESSSIEPCDVLNTHDTGSKLANASGKLPPESRSIPFQTNTLPGVADVLTGEPSDEHVDGSGVVMIATSSGVPPGVAFAPRVTFASDSRSLTTGVGQSEPSNVVVAGHVRPVLPERVAAEWVGFAGPDDFESGPLEAEIESADAGEEAADGIRSVGRSVGRSVHHSCQSRRSR